MGFSFANSRARYRIISIVKTVSILVFSFCHLSSAHISTNGNITFSKTKRFLETHKYLSFDSFLRLYNYAIEIKANMFLKVHHMKATLKRY